MVKIKLRAIEQTDLSKILEWRNLSEVMPYCRQYRPLSLSDIETWYENLTRDKDYNLTNDLFLLTYDLVPFGVGGLVRLDWRNRKGELSFYVGNTDCSTEKIITESLILLIHYAFKTLGLHKVYWPVYSFNPNLSIYEKVLKREYVAKQEYYWNGKFEDRIILSCINTQ